MQTDMFLIQSLKRRIGNGAVFIPASELKQKDELEVLETYFLYGTDYSSTPQTTKNFSRLILKSFQVHRL